MEHFYSLSETVVGTLLTVALKQERTKRENIYSLSETVVGTLLTVALKQERTKRGTLLQPQ